MRNLWCTKEGWEEKTLSASMEENHSSEILWVLYTWVFLSKTHGFSAFKPRHVSQRSVPLLPQLHPQPTRCLGLSVHPMKIDFLLFPTLNLLLLRFFALPSCSGAARYSSRGSGSPPESPLLLFIAFFQHEIRSSFPQATPVYAPSFFSWLNFS